MAMQGGRRWKRTALACALAACVASISTAFLAASGPARLLPEVFPCRTRNWQRPSSSCLWEALAAAATVFVAAGLRLKPERQRGLQTNEKAQRGPLALAAWPFGQDDDDPYSRCTALKLQVGLQFSKQLLATLNKLSESADSESDQGLHVLLLDVILALRRAESSWRYVNCERLLLDAGDEGRAAAAAIQKWGIEGQSKYGDGEDWEKIDKSAPAGLTEYIVVTLLISCYGALLPTEQNLKVRNTTDLKKVLDAASGIQVDELMQLDVQWIPEEEGDSLSSMEITVKFPEMILL